MMGVADTPVSSLPLEVWHSRPPAAKLCPKTVGVGRYVHCLALGMPANARKEKSAARPQVTKRSGVANPRRNARPADGPTSSRRRTSRPNALFRAGPLRTAMTAIDSLLDRSGRALKESRREIVAKAKGGLSRLFRRSPQRVARPKYH
jgi:hypothetical protein